ncbi:MAG: family N-acetyltransferase [Caulobacter sp.]|nr:family N-acetyltransferase [Caulobacter sp.]
MTLRRAVLADAPAIAAVYRLSAWHPHIHTPEEDVAFFSGRMLPEQTVWVVEDGQGVVVAFAAAQGDFLNHLFVHPDAQGMGHGSRLLEHVRGGLDFLQLWTFQGNVRARAFYEAHDFAAAEFTDGEGNEEKLPDVRYEWRRLA